MFETVKTKGPIYGIAETQRINLFNTLTKSPLPWTEYTKEYVLYQYICDNRKNSWLWVGSVCFEKRAYGNWKEKLVGAGREEIGGEWIVDRFECL